MLTDENMYKTLEQVCNNIVKDLSNASIYDDGHFDENIKEEPHLTPKLVSETIFGHTQAAFGNDMYVDPQVYFGEEDYDSDTDVPNVLAISPEYADFGTTYTYSAPPATPGELISYAGTHYRTDDEGNQILADVDRLVAFADEANDNANNKAYNSLNSFIESTLNGRLSETDVDDISERKTENQSGEVQSVSEIQMKSGETFTFIQQESGLSSVTTEADYYVGRTELETQECIAELTADETQKLTDCINKIQKTFEKKAGKTVPSEFETITEEAEKEQAEYDKKEESPAD